MPLFVPFVLFAIGGALGHTWLNNPAARFPSTPNYCITRDNGTLYYENSQTVPICGSDAQGVNILGLRPTTWNQDPCFYRSGHNWAGAPDAVVQTGTPMCADWNSNGHIADPYRNAGGGIRFSLIPFSEHPTQADFDANIIARGIPYEYITGAKFQIPNVPAGVYTLQMMWDWPTATKEYIYVSCADINVVNAGDPLLTTQQSAEYGMGLPQAYHPDPSWHCNPTDPVYSNTSAGPVYNAPASSGGGVTSSPTSAPTSAPSTGSATAAPTAPATSAPSPAPTAASAVPATCSKKPTLPLVSSIPADNTCSGMTQLHAMQDLYNQLGGAQWTHNTNWMVGDPCTNQWYGVTCNQGNVINIDLHSNNLSGNQLPASVGCLAFLQGLALDNNAIYGQLPNNLCKLTNTKTLSLSNNNIGGTIPICFAGLVNLQSLTLSGNALFGGLPDFSRYQGLKYLQVQDNCLSGQIPQSYGTSIVLNTVLDRNYFSGCIPDAPYRNLGTFTGNLFCSGDIPCWLSSATLGCPAGPARHNVAGPFSDCAASCLSEL